MKRFKKGDICFYRGSVADYIFILKSVSKWSIKCYIGYSTFLNHVFDNPVTSSKNVEQVRLATLQEKEKLLNLLAKKGLSWDEENLELVNEI